MSPTPSVSNWTVQYPPRKLLETCRAFAVERATSARSAFRPCRCSGISRPQLLDGGPRGEHRANGRVQISRASPACSISRSIFTPALLARLNDLPQLVSISTRIGIEIVARHETTRPLRRDRAARRALAHDGCQCGVPGKHDLDGVYGDLGVPRSIASKSSAISARADLRLVSISARGVLRPVATRHPAHVCAGESLKPWGGRCWVGEPKPSGSLWLQLLHDFSSRS